MSSTEPKMKKRSSHFKGGLLAGAIFGIAAGIFMSSKQGKQLTKQLQNRTKEIQTRLYKELKKSKKLTEATYEKAIENVLEHYAKTRAIAAKEIPELRRYLLAKWKEVKREFGA